MLEGSKLYSNISGVQSCNICILSLKTCARNKLFFARNKNKVLESAKLLTVAFILNTTVHSFSEYGEACYVHYLIFRERVLDFFLLHKFSYTTISAHLEQNSSRTVENELCCQKCEEAVT